MIKAVLFDLDGTLLPMDQDVFVKSFSGSLAKKMETEKNYDGKLFAKAVNCECPVGGSPCLKCRSCQDIDAGLAASIFHFGEVAIPDLKSELKKNGINVRL